MDEGTALDRSGEYAADELWTELYDELRRVAKAELRRQPKDLLETTALVHEAFAKLRAERTPADRRHFQCLVARVMRCILVDQARRSTSLKRGGGRAAEVIEDLDELAERPAERGPTLEALAVDEALAWLAEQDPQQAKICELHFFGGLTREEVKSTLGVSGHQFGLATARLRVRLMRDEAEGGELGHDG